jgi:hypothetical protein
MGPPFLDLEWGLFGSQVGPVALRCVRTVLLAELVLAIALSSRRGANDVLVLSFAAFIVATLPSIIHVGLNTPAAESSSQLSTHSCRTA